MKQLTKQTWQKLLLFSAIALLALPAAAQGPKVVQGTPASCVGNNYIVLDSPNNVLYSCGAGGSVPTPAGDMWISILTSNTPQATANVTTDQNLLSSTIGTTTQVPMNTAGRTILYNGNGTYNLGAASTIQIKLKLCSVAGCGSGTVVTLASWLTGSQATTGVTLAFSVSAQCSTVTIGGTGTMECHGTLNFDSGATLAAAISGFNDSNIAVISGLPLNAQWFLQSTLAYGTANASNTALMRQQVVQVNGPGVLN